MEKELDDLYNKAIQLIKQKRVNEALDIINETALKGHVASQRGLGIAYMFGQFALKNDYEKAAYWFSEAIKNNDAISYNNLGMLYLEGKGVLQNINLAIEYITKAADLGFIDAQHNLADFYLAGRHIKPDRSIAEKYYQKAYEQGDKHAVFMLANIKLFTTSAGNELYKESKNLFRNSFPSQYNNEAKTMLQLLENASKKEVHNKIWALDELLKKLGKEGGENIYYRGQTNFYGHPLPVSMYRYPQSAHPINYNGDARLRNVGKSFYFEDSFAGEKTTGQKIKRELSRYINNAFGYVFTQALFQQAGYTSEGLDITSDIIIALFFSTYDYDTKNGKFYVDDKREYSVLYRWKNLKQYSAKDILQKDYYSCPALIPTFDILQSFETCETIDEFNDSLHNYAKAINWDWNFGLHEVRGQRPFNFLKFPKKLVKNSRIIRQKASLLLPDIVLSEDLARLFTDQGFAPPKYMPYLPLALKQDLSEKGYCEIFIYKRNNQLAKQILKDNKILPKDLYNEQEEDLSHLLLYGWIENFNKSVYSKGTLPIQIKSHEELSHAEILSFLNKLQSKKQNAGYYFEE